MKRPLFLISLVLIFIVFCFNYLSIAVSLAISLIISLLILIFVRNNELKAVFIIMILASCLSCSFLAERNNAVIKAKDGREENYRLYIYDVKEHTRVVTLKGKLEIADNIKTSDVSLYLVPQEKYFPGDIISFKGILDFPEGESINLKPQVSKAKITSRGKSIYKPYYYLGRLRQSLNEASLSITNKDIGSLFPSLLTGSKNYLEDDIKRSLYDGGIAHIAAVSGLHLSIILSFVFFVLPLKRKAKLIAAFFLCFFIAGISAFSPSILRASLMALVFLASFVVKRNSDGITSLAAFVVLAAVFYPKLLFSLSAWFSCLSVFGILSLVPYLSAKIPQRVKNIAPLNFIINGLLVSFAAGFLTLPLCLHFFGSFSALSLFLNVFVVPMVSIILPVLWAEVLIILLFGVHLPLFDFIITRGCELIVSMAEPVGRSDIFRLAGYRSYIIVLLIALGAAVSFMALKNVKLKFTACAFAVFFLILNVCQYAYEEIYEDDIFAIFPENESCAVIKNGGKAVLIGNLTNKYAAECMRGTLRKYDVRKIEGIYVDYDESASAVLYQFLKDFDCPAADESLKVVDYKNYPVESFIKDLGGTIKSEKDEISFDMQDFKILKRKKKCDIINNYRITKSRGTGTVRLSRG